MQKKIKVVFASLLCACVASTIGMTACGKDGTTPKIGDNGNWFIGETDTGVKAEGGSGKSAYQVWLDAGHTGTEQDFLDSLKGADGDNGVSPEIKDGYWWIGDKNTNIKAEGADGDDGISPEIKDGYWWIGDTNTNIKAEGTNGARGNKITKGEGAPTSTEGAIEGDMYVDTEEWNVYFFESDSWVNYGSIKGADGTGGSVSPEQSTIKLSVNANETTDVDIPADTAQGVHIIEANLGETKLSTGRLQMYISGKEGVKSELVFSESRSDAQHKVYFSYINVAEGDSKITFYAEGEAVNADISIKDYEMPTLKADGTPIEVPVNLNAVSTMDAAVFKFKVDLDSVVASGYNYTWSTNVASEVQSNVKLLFGGEKGLTFSTSKFAGGTLTIKQSDHLDGCNGEAFFQVSSSGDTYNFIYPITITLTKSS